VITSTPFRKKWESIRAKIGIAAVSGMTTLTAPNVSATIARRTPAFSARPAKTKWISGHPRQA
jgi:hypothetical protein